MAFNSLFYFYSRSKNIIKRYDTFVDKLKNNFIIMSLDIEYADFQYANSSIVSKFKFLLHVELRSLDELLENFLFFTFVNIISFILTIF